MHRVQEHVNTLGIYCSIQRLTEYMKQIFSFPTQSVTIKLRQHKSIPAQQIPDRKNRECAGAGIQPTTFYTCAMYMKDVEK